MGAPKRVGYLASKRIKGDRPAVISLDHQKASLPGFSDGYGTPAGSGSAQGDHHPYWQIEFDQAAEERCWWYFSLPRNFDADKNIKVKVHWKAATAVTGDVVFGTSVLGRVEGEVFDAAMGTEVNSATSTTQDVAGEITTTEIELTPTQHALAAGDVVVLQLARKVAEAGDDLAEDADVVMVEFEYAVDPRVQY